MNKTASRWNRSLQLLGLLLIAVLSVGSEAARAQDEDDDRCWIFDRCEICQSTEDPKCITVFCPVGDPRGIEVICKK